jgi:hypothetical protein
MPLLRHSYNEGTCDVIHTCGVHEEEVRMTEIEKLASGTIASEARQLLLLPSRKSTVVEIALISTSSANQRRHSD